MPIYEYRCTACGHEFEVLQKVGERRRRTCEKCSGKLEKLISRTSFQLKGGGWYDSGYSKSGSSSSSADSSSDSSDKPKKTGKDSKISSSDTKKKDAKKTAAL